MKDNIHIFELIAFSAEKIAVVWGKTLKLRVVSWPKQEIAFAEIKKPFAI
jgi:hypothetical protein